MTENKVSLFQDSEKLGIFAIGKHNPPIFEAFLNLAHEVMHPESAFKPLTRELLGAYVSKKFGCSFCHLGHIETAFAIGGEDVRGLVDTSSEELKPIFSVADKVIANQIIEDDVQTFLNLGYTEKHYQDIVLFVPCLVLRTEWLQVLV